MTTRLPPLQRPYMLDRGLEHIGVFIGALGREAAAGLRPAIEDKARGAVGLAERRRANEARAIDAPPPFRRRKIQPVGRERLIGRAARIGVMRAFARVVIILDQRKTFAGGVLDERVEDERRRPSIVEQRVELLVEQRQPMFEAWMAAAFADRLIKPVARVCAPKQAT